MSSSSTTSYTRLPDLPYGEESLQAKTSLDIRIWPSNVLSIDFQETYIKVNWKFLYSIHIYLNWHKWKYLILILRQRIQGLVTHVDRRRW